ncbi:MAG: excinuclease ABC subunit UvrA [Candidatus Poseidoniaceae archaeon]|nr:excinuclease ABC subunit UvrA [Candidatus Poseidoniaceae archaeon]
MSKKNTSSKQTPNSEVEWISVRGARTHNLKNIDIEIPRGKFVVFSGVSGSGKSSLAFDTLYAEGQRRYVESLSSYARQFIGQMKKADCDGIEGLSPAISIDQKSGSHNPRSTVATATEIMDYLRLLWARIGQPHCPECGKQVSLRTVQDIVDDIVFRFEQHAISIWAPIIRSRKGTHLDLFNNLVEQGWLHGKVNGREADFENRPDLDKNLRHDIDVRIDRLLLSSENRQRLTEAVEQALRLGGGTIAVESIEAPSQTQQITEGSIANTTEKGAVEAYSETFACPQHGAFMSEMSPRVFSFNSPLGACPSCQGLGIKRTFSIDLLLTPERSVSEGCIKAFQSSINAGWYRGLMEQTAQHYGISIDIPFSHLKEDEQDILLYGSGSTVIDFTFTSKRGSTYNMRRPWEGVVNRLNKTYTETTSEKNRARLSAYMNDEPCIDCSGAKLNAAARGVTVGGVTLQGLSFCSIHSALSVVKRWNGEDLADSNLPKELRKKCTPLDERSSFIGREVIKEIESRLIFLDRVGLDYLTLDRRANTLSGGESQRIRLATQIGSRLTGVMYVLDEPSIGLHQRDNDLLLTTLRELTELGNTLIVVEHDEDTLRQADWIVDLGIGAGRDGGNIVASGPLKEIINSKESITGAYLSNRRQIPIPTSRNSPEKGWISISGAEVNNLAQIDARFPLACLIAITGVSGSGKSSLVTETLAPLLQRQLHNAEVSPGKHSGSEGIEKIDKAIVIDQAPIGRTPRSNPATYTKCFEDIRKLFAGTTLAKERGYTQGHFSFNVRGGRCEACKGAGSLKLEMNFLPNVWITCDTCKGKRYTRETLEVLWKGKNIHQILEMSVAEATEFFANHRRLYRILSTLNAVGLGYIRLGQPATTLSGGEAQRVKLASELGRPSYKHTLYILDEPTTGLAFSDVEQLIVVLQQLRDKGHTVLVIEHHLDVIKSADWIIDLGPEGGERGGKIIATGTPEDVAKVKRSFTGQHLKPLLNQGKKKSV